MYYYKARIYSPKLGRFLQTDPIGYEDQFNLYAYVGNDPVNSIDPSGLSDLNLFHETETVLHETGERLEPNNEMPGVFTITGHGYPDGETILDNRGPKVELTPSALLALARKNGYEDGMAIIITACNCGKGFAQELANITDSPVYAPDGLSSVSQSEFKSGDVRLRSFGLRNNTTRENQGGWWRFSKDDAPLRMGDSLVWTGKQAVFQFSDPHPNPYKIVDGVLKPKPK